jgi:hypothetical protein
MRFANSLSVKAAQSISFLSFGNILAVLVLCSTLPEQLSEATEDKQDSEANTVVAIRDADSDTHDSCYLEHHCEDGVGDVI